MFDDAHKNTWKQRYAYGIATKLRHVKPKDKLSACFNADDVHEFWLQVGSRNKVDGGRRTKYDEILSDVGCSWCQWRQVRGYNRRAMVDKGRYVCFYSDIKRVNMNGDEQVFPLKEDLVVGNGGPG